MRRSLLPAAALAAVLPVPSPAGAAVQIGQGIAGARLDGTRAQVRAALGRPSRVVNGRNPFGPVTQFVYRGIGVTVTFQGRRRVSSVSTTGLGDRTARGVGVGSPERAVRRRVRGVRCETVAVLRSCQVGRSLPGRRVTVFFIRGGRVSRVVVGFVLD